MDHIVKQLKPPSFEPRLELEWKLHWPNINVDEIPVFWNVPLGRFLNSYRRFGSVCCFHLHGLSSQRDALGFEQCRNSSAT